MELKRKKKKLNGFEKEIRTQLKRAKVQFKFEGEKIPYVQAKHYKPDFVIVTPNGIIYVECKGYFRPEHKAKMKAVKRQHPEKDIRLLFYREVKAYIRWAEKNGFIYAIRKVPKEWLQGL